MPIHVLKAIVFSTLFLLSSLSFAQEKTIFIHIYDNSKKELAFANVLNLSLHIGSTSDFDGKAAIKYNNEEDKIQISYIGFDIYSSTIGDLIENPNIFLKARVQEIPTVEVSEVSDFLYELVHSCRKSKTFTLDTAKTYFLLLSKQNEREIERMEAYYNGIYESYDLISLDLKKARVSIDTISNDRYFVSQQTSKVIGLIETFKNSPYFPTQPLELNKKELKKRYKLSYLSSFKNNKGHHIYEIEAKPKKEGFHATLLVNMDRRFIEKIKLKYTNAKNSPFQPIWKTDHLDKIDFEIEKIFFQKDGKIQPSSIHFYYDLDYVNRLGESYRINSEAVLYPYDYKTPFKLPLFDFENVPSDYSKIFGIPYDTNFWTFNKEFKLDNSPKEENIKWICETPEYFDSRLEESKYQIWKGGKSRILLRNLEPILDNSSNLDRSSSIKSDKYNLEVQWYFDYSYYNDSLYFNSYTLFDPFQSFYQLDIDNSTLAFINMYFDLHELYRRQFIGKIHASQDVDSLFIVEKRKLNTQISTFIKEVERGENLNQMERWNNLILKELGINNMSIFGLSIDK